MDIDTQTDAEKQPPTLSWDEIRENAIAEADLMTPGACHTFLKHLKTAPWDLVAIDPQGRASLIGERCRTLDAAEAFVEQHNGKRNIYVHVNEPTQAPKNGKAKKGDIAHVHNLHIDMDFKDIAPLLPSPDGGYGAYESFLHKKLDAFEYCPSMIVRSGGGYNLYFRLDKSHEVESQADIDRIEAANRGLAQHFNGDSVHDVSRILRVPGTVNIPTEAKRKAGRVPVSVAACQVFRQSTQEAHALQFLIEDLKQQKRKATGDAAEQIETQISKLKRQATHGADKRIGGTWITENGLEYRPPADAGPFLTHSLEELEMALPKPEEPSNVVAFPNSQAAPTGTPRSRKELATALPKSLKTWLKQERGPQGDRSSHAHKLTLCLMEEGLTDEEILDLGHLPFASKFRNRGDWKKEVERTRAVWIKNGSKRRDRKSTEWNEPIPLGDDLAPVRPFDYELLPENLRAWVQDIAERMQCPPDFVAVVAMIVAATLIGRKVGIAPQEHTSWIEAANLWGVIIGPPGIMKTPAAEEALAPLKALLVGARSKYAKDLAHHEIEQRKAELRTKAREKEAAAKLKKNSNADLDELFGDDDCSSEQPVEKRYMTNASTVEKLHRILAENPQGILINRDELVSLLTMLDREEKATDRGFYLTAWGGNSTYLADTVGSGTIYVEAACISLIGTTQPAKIGAYLKRALAFSGDDGLIARFGMLVWPDIERAWHNVDRSPDPDARDRAIAMFKELDEIDGDVLDVIEDHNGMPVLRFTTDARQAFEAWRGPWEDMLRSEDLHPALIAHFSKYRKLVPSLALICALVDGDRSAVGVDAVNRAVAWAEYLKSHAERAYGAVTAATNKQAKKLLKTLRERQLTSPFTLRDIQRKQWSGLTEKHDIRDVLELLEEHFWLDAEPKEKSGLGGRPSVEYTVNPALFREGVKF